MAVIAGPRQSTITPALTTMALPLHRMGVAAAEMMLRSPAGSGKVEDVWFTPELAVRESTAPPNRHPSKRAG